MGDGEEDEISTFRLEVNARSRMPNPYAWEIYREGSEACVEQSTERFASPAAAHRAGLEALRRWNAKEEG